MLKGNIKEKRIFVEVLGESNIPRLMALGGLFLETINRTFNCKFGEYFTI